MRIIRNVKLFIISSCHEGHKDIHKFWPIPKSTMHCTLCIFYSHILHFLSMCTGLQGYLTGTSKHLAQGKESHRSPLRIFHR